MTTDKEKRKQQPIARGCLDYFPDALAEIAHVSYVGNQQHNPGEELHWARGKSNDHADCLVRHLLERGTTDDDGLSHTAKAAWRALALLQIELENQPIATRERLEEIAAEDFKFSPPLDPGELRNQDALSHLEDFTDPHKEHYGLNRRAEAKEKAVASDSRGQRVHAAVPSPLLPLSGSLQSQTGKAVDADNSTLQTPPGVPPLRVQQASCRVDVRPSRSGNKDDIDYQRLGWSKVENDQSGNPQVPSSVLQLPHDQDSGESRRERDSSKPRIYLAGPMRGYADFNFPAFDSAKQMLAHLGWAPISPADMDRELDKGVQHSQRHYAKRDCAAILECDAIYMLKGWEQSKGATAEHALAVWAELEIILEV